MTNIYRIILFIAFALPFSVYAQDTDMPKWQGEEETAKVRLCFVPGMNCTKLVTAKIEEAEQEILVEAYGFTSANIAEALIAAKARGVDVQMIADRTNLTDKYSQVRMLKEYNIPVYANVNRAGIAHNKIMIIDDRYVLTGSFNWTNAAQKKNTENLLLIDDVWVAQVYKANWYKSLNSIKKSTEKQRVNR